MVSPSSRIVIILLAIIVLWDVSCPPGETVTDAIRRIHKARPTLTKILVGVFVTHLLEYLPQQVDPLHYALLWKAQA